MERRIAGTPRVWGILQEKQNAMLRRSHIFQFLRRFDLLGRIGNKILVVGCVKNCDCTHALWLQIHFSCFVSRFSIFSSNPGFCAQNRKWQTGFMMTSAIFLFLALYTCFVGAQNSYVEFANDPDQRKICRLRTSEAACLELDAKCGWNTFQQLCNEKGHQPLVQHCNVCLKPG